MRVKDSDLRIALSDGRVNTPKAPRGQHVGAIGWCVVPPLWEGDQHMFLQYFCCNAFHCHTQDEPLLFVRAVSNMACATEREFSMAC